MVCWPSDRVDVLNEARPVLLSETTVSLPPSMWNVTEPVGTTLLPCDETTAVNVTVSPGNEVLSDEESVVVVSRALTSCVTLSDVLLLKLTVLLMYWAEI